MAKVITHQELAQIVHGLLTNPEALGELCERSTYEGFVGAIAEVVADHCGGEIGGVDWIETDHDPDELHCTFIVRGNDSLPPDGGIWKFFDAEGDFDGIDLPQVKPAWPEDLMPKVIIELDGGLVQNVLADRPMQIDVLDFDVEGADEATIVEVPNPRDNSRVFDVCPSRITPEIDPAGVQAVIDAIERQWLSVGDEVFWNDPDNGFSSGYAVIVEIMSESGKVEERDTILRLKTPAGSEIEAFAHELS